MVHEIYRTPADSASTDAEDRQNRLLWSLYEAANRSLDMYISVQHIQQESGLRVADADLIHLTTRGWIARRGAYFALTSLGLVHIQSCLLRQNCASRSISAAQFRQPESLAETFDNGEHERVDLVQPRGVRTEQNMELVRDLAHRVEQLPEGQRPEARELFNTLIEQLTSPAAEVTRAMAAGNALIMMFKVTPDLANASEAVGRIMNLVLGRRK